MALSSSKKLSSLPRKTRWELSSCFRGWGGGVRSFVLKVGGQTRFLCLKVGGAPPFLLERMLSSMFR